MNLKPECSLSVDVLDEAGKPAPDVGVGVMSGSGDQYSLTPEAGKPGWYHVDQIPDGDYTLSVHSGDGGATRSEKLHLKPGESLSRTVRWPAARAVPASR